MAQFYEYIKMAIDNIRHNKGRSVLTMLGIIIGISSVIMIMSVGAGVKDEMNDEMNKIAGGQVAIYVNDAVAGEEEYFTQSDMEAIKEKVNGAKGVTPDETYYGGMVKSNKTDEELTLNMGTVDLNLLKSLGIERGRYFSEEEFEEGKRVCVIDKNDAIRMFGTSDVVGMSLDVTWYDVTKEFQIVGVRSVEEDSVFSEMFTYSYGAVNLEIPYTAMVHLDWEMDSFYVLYIMTEDEADSKQVTKDALTLAEARHRGTGTEMYLSQDFNDQMDSINEMLNMLTIFISFVAAISLLVGGIGVMNIMLVSVTERTREIGIRKALGAKTKSIMTQFLFESAIITCIGGIIGIALGIGGAYLICSLPMLGMAPGVKLSTIIITTIFSSFVGIFFGIYPAKKAAKLSPIEALRRN